MAPLSHSFCSLEAKCPDDLTEKEHCASHHDRELLRNLGEDHSHNYTSSTVPSSSPVINTGTLRTYLRESVEPASSGATIDSCCSSPLDRQIGTQAKKTCSSHRQPSRTSSLPGLAHIIPSHEMRNHHGHHHHGVSQDWEGAAHNCTKSSSTQTPSTCCADHLFKEPLLNEIDVISETSDDAERGPATIDHVALTVNGLKCGCCDAGLHKALRRIKAIQNHQVNIVLARIEFDLDTSRRSLQEVIFSLQKATGYTFEQYEQPDGQVLELQILEPEDLHRAGRPYGVTSLDAGGKQHWRPSMLFSGGNSATLATSQGSVSFRHKRDNTLEQRSLVSLSLHTVRVHYNAKLIGARDVFEYYRKLVPQNRLQLAPANSNPSLAVGAQQMRRECLMFMISFLFTVPVLVMAWAPLNHRNIIYAHVSLALATVVQVIAVKEFVPGAWQSLVRSRVFEMDALIALSTTMAYLFSIVSYVFQVRHRPLETGSFFETSTLLVTLILLGRAISEFARFKAAKSVSIRSLQNLSALIVSSKTPTGPGSEARQIDARLLQYGDRFKVLPHTRIVTDGIVIYGGSEVDESMITGESIPVAKGLGQEVYAGTVNGTGPLIISLTKLPHENAVSRIATMVETAEITKPKIQALADVVVGWFVPTIASIGTAVFLIWIFVDRFHYHRTWGQAITKAITYAIATLVVSCPCAIGLAVPMVVLIAGGMAARFGIIFRDPQKLEVARNVTDVVFDKTGTLTSGELAVAEATFYSADVQQTKSMIMGLLVGDNHPVATAVYRSLVKDLKEDQNLGIPLLKVVDTKSEPGNGISGLCEETKLEIRAGNPQWLGVSVLESAHTVLCVTISGVLSATFRLHDTARSNAHLVIGRLKARGIKIHLCSGDSEGAVSKIAHTLDITKRQTRWRLKPEDKQKYIYDLQKNGSIVMFCGDGTNDSVALKQADVGVHINHGSDVAKSASDVVLMSAHLKDILILLDISAAAYRRIIINFSWSFIYNLVAILMAAGAFVKVRIPAAYAGLGELVSVLPIMLIAFQLKLKNYGKKYQSLEGE